MPLYTFQCPNCWHRTNAFRKIADRDNTPHCDGCGPIRGLPGFFRMDRVIEAPAVHADLPGYQSPIDGSWVEGRRARNEDLKRNNCRPWEGMSTERNEAIKRADEADKKFETSIEKGIADTFNNMSVEKQRVLNEAIG